MSTLSQNERDGLDDVFSSIHSTNNNYKYIKELFTFVILKTKNIFSTKFFRKAKYGIKNSFSAHSLAISNKKKKNLSK